LERCPLCRADNRDTLHASSPSGGGYLRCNTCDLIYVTFDGILSPAEEQSRYLTHDNTHENAGYVDMLTRFIERAVTPHISTGKALEFGCGPGPVLADLLEARGFSVSLYDPYFAPDPGPLDCTYDIVTSTEVLEHVTDARSLWDRLRQLVKPGGYLAFTTRFHPGADAFAEWWYRRDPTHIRFYSRNTIRWAAAEYDWDLLLLDDRDTATLRRPR